MWALPSLPFELQREIIFQGLVHERSSHPKDNILTIIKNREVLSRACLVSKAWKDVALPLLYREVVFWDPEANERDQHLLGLFARTITSSPALAALVEHLDPCVAHVACRAEVDVQASLLRIIPFLPNLKVLSGLRSKCPGHPQSTAEDPLFSPARLTSLHVREHEHTIEKFFTDFVALDLSDLKSLTVEGRDKNRLRLLRSTPVDPGSASGRWSCFHPPADVPLKMPTLPHLASLEEVRLSGSKFGLETMTSIVSALGPRLKTLHLSFSRSLAAHDGHQAFFSDLTRRFPNLEEISIHAIEPDQDQPHLHDHTPPKLCLFREDDQLIAAKLERLLIGDPTECFAEEDLSVVRKQVQPVYDFLAATYDPATGASWRLPALKAVGLWIISFRQEESRDEEHVAYAARLLATVGVELRDRSGTAWREEWMLETEADDSSDDDTSDEEEQVEDVLDEEGVDRIPIPTCEAAVASAALELEGLREERRLWGDEETPPKLKWQCHLEHSSGDACEPGDAKLCGRCRRVAYCSEAHQRIDWPSHKIVCSLRL